MLQVKTGTSGHHQFKHMTKLMISIYLASLLYGCVRVYSSTGKSNASGEVNKAKAKVDIVSDIAVKGVAVDGE